MTALWVIIACGLLAIVYAAWATRSVLNADAGSKKFSFPHGRSVVEHRYVLHGPPAGQRLKERKDVIEVLVGQ